MPFSPSVKEAVLVKSWRRCALCGCYKGVNVEVHHIVQEAVGGPNTEENAICLCFDCHAGAGHYNPKHPRGTKFSPEELRRQRDEFYKAIEDSRLSLSVKDQFPECYTRYLVVMSPELVERMFKKRIGEAPFKYTYIYKNRVYDFVDAIVSDEFCHVGFKNLGEYGSEDALLVDYPELRNSDSRRLTRQDVGKMTIESKLLMKIVNSNFDVESFGLVRKVWDGCGGGQWFVEAICRRPYFVFLQIENRSNFSFCIDRFRIEGSRPSGFVWPLDEERVDSEITEEHIMLAPGESVLVPTACLLGPVGYDPLSLDYEVGALEEGCEYSSVGYRYDDSERDYYGFGHFFIPREMSLKVNNNSELFAFHKFDPKRCYVVDMQWMCGSCPHVYFFVHGYWVYYGEILQNSSPSCSENCLVRVPLGATKCRIVELENEICFVKSVRIGACCLFQNVFLRKGDALEFEITGLSNVEIVGYYDALLARPLDYRMRRSKDSLRIAYQKNTLCILST
ncbi:hypothetical protein GTA51_03885 [Desulfovibrio aerotolerans]|uniref:HNH nuclease domain-containing protein n=1 Tax=Solidesulfovibrio aerotolerans TaxID=295255 RepID=A0A7C9J7L1_9BACT|nr:HNH endonuclease [Solidesulfovibrio aerotolerans]MYL82278.1 hypothetical protein [Solidesulfovibrio aerotolerans]